MSMTQPGLPLAGANSLLHHYKQLQKMKELPKTWVSPNNRLKISDQKNQKLHSWHGEQSKQTKRS